MAMNPFLNQYSARYKLMIIYIICSLVVSYSYLLKPAGVPDGTSVNEAQPQQERFLSLTEDIKQLQSKQPFLLFLISLVLSLMLGAGIVLNLILVLFHFVSRSGKKAVTKSGSPLKIDITDVIKGAVIFLFLQLLLIDIKSYIIPVDNEVMRISFLILGTAGVYSAVIYFFYVVLKQKNSDLKSRIYGSFTQFSKNIGVGLAGYVVFLPYFFSLVLFSLSLAHLFNMTPQAHPIVTIFKQEQSRHIIIYLAFFAMVLAPVAEELIFRGIIYTMLKQRYGLYMGVAATSFLFALLHFNLFQFIPIVGLSIMLTLLYEKTNSLVASCTFHIINNSVAMLFTYLIIGE